MANSLLSVSYLEVYQNWIRNDRDRNNGQSTIPITDIARNLRLDTLLKKTEHQTVDGKETDDDKLIKLFHEYMPGKGVVGFNQVVNCLYTTNYIGLADDLVAQMKNCLDFHDGAMTEQNQTDVDVHQTTLTIAKPLTMPHAPLKLQNPLMAEAQEHLSKFIIDNVDFMVEFWSGLINIPRTWNAFVDVQVLEDFKDDKGKPVHEYKGVFKNVTTNPFKRILIQGDPGCGKSTYVNKIALDWANKNEYLREMFDLVFLIPLQTLSTNIEQAIRDLLPVDSVEFVEKYYKRHSSKVLLILDGFDEFPEDSQFYSEVMSMMKGDRSMAQYSFFTTIVTSRRSHVDKVPQRYHERSLLIKGFNEKSMEQFLQRQQVPVPDEQTNSNLVVLLQNPLFCAIYCSLYFFGNDKSKLEDPYDFIKALVENTVKNDKRTKEITNEEDQLKLLGAFAFQKLNTETLNIVDNIFNQKDVFDDDFSIFLKEKPPHTQTIDMDQIQLGLLIKKKIQSVGGEYKQEFGFPHQLIAEYLAARYFVHHGLTESQLNQLQPDELVFLYRKKPETLLQLIVSSPSSFPLVRFLLLEYVGSHFNDERRGREVLSRFLSDEIRFSCYFKSNIETPTINDITSLYCFEIDKDITNDSRFFPTLAKCINLKSLNLQMFWEPSTNEVNELVNLFQKNHLPKLTQLRLSHNANVCSAPDFFTALGNCKHLQDLKLDFCELSIESINRLTTCIENNCWENLSQLDLTRNENINSTHDFFTALSNCKHLQSLDLSLCDLSIVSINRLATCIDSKCWENLSQLDLSDNTNIGLTHDFFTALGNCKHLQSLKLKWCHLSIVSINRLTTCIGNNCWPNLTTLDLCGNTNVGNASELFCILYNCLDLEKLDLSYCSMTNLSMDTFLLTFNLNTFQNLWMLALNGNEKLKIDDNFYLSVLGCSKFRYVNFGLSKCQLSLSGQEAKKVLLDRGCEIH